MNIDKSQILDMLRSQGDESKVQQADQQLPDQVDTDNGAHQSLLQKLGVDPSALLKRFLPGGGGGGIPGL
jgi:hypothetical protein